MSDVRVEYILAHSDPLDVANAVHAAVDGLTWEAFYEIATHGRPRLAGSYREELNEVLALDPPYVREAFYKFLQRNPRTLGSFGKPFVSRVAMHLEHSSPPLFGDSRIATRRRAWMYAGAIATAFALGVAITMFVMHSRSPIEAASRKPFFTPHRAHAAAPVHKAAPPPVYRRDANEVINDQSATGNPVVAAPATPAPAPALQRVNAQKPEPSPVAPARVVRRSNPPTRPPNGKGEAVVAVPVASPTATPPEDPIDAESGTPVWRKGTVNVQATPAQAPSVQDEGVPHESKAIPIHTATPPPPKPKATQKPGLINSVLKGAKGPAPSPSPSP